MSILNNIFGKKMEGVTDSIESSGSIENVNVNDLVPDINLDESEPHKFSGWKLIFVYRMIDDTLNQFHISKNPTETLGDSDRNKELLQSIVMNIHEQLNTVTDEEGFINLDNSLVIRKNQFVSVSVVNSP